MQRYRQKRWIWACAVAAVAALTYWQALQLSLIADDYVVIELGAQFTATAEGFRSLWSDGMYRCRALYMLMTGWLYPHLGLEPLGYNLIGIALHAINCLLIFALGMWPAIGWRISIPAAIFFAFHHGHQEAVIWYSALPDQMVFFFLLLSALAFVEWLRNKRRIWYCGAFALYLLALLSKESGVAIAGVLPLVYWIERRDAKAALRAASPFLLTAVAYFFWGYAGRQAHQHYNDGTFALGLHFIPVMAASVWRMLWPWGLVALAAIGAWRWIYLRLAVGAFVFMAIALGPYSFLTYMPFVPSRHTYIASLGLALIAAAGFITLWDRFYRRPRAVAALAAAVMCVEWGYLWTRKHQQYLDRIAPTDNLIAKAKDRTGTLVLNCFPYSIWVAKSALKLHYGERVAVRLASGEVDKKCDKPDAIQMAFHP